MKILKLSKPEFGTWTESDGTPINVPCIHAGEPKGHSSLGQVINRLRQPYLCQLKKEIEGVRKEKGKGYDLQEILISGRFLKGQHYFPLNVDNHEVWEKASEKEKLDEVYYFLDSYFPVFGAEPNLGAIVFRDLVMIRDNYTEKYEFYSTPEVLKVLEQWIEYLEKFEQEKAR